MSAREQSTSILTMRCTISLGLGHYFPGNPKAKRMRIEKRREKSVPKSTRLDRALGRMQAGAAEVNLMRLLPRANMEDKLTSLITYAKAHQHVSSIELQGTPLGMSNGMPK